MTKLRSHLGITVLVVAAAAALPSIARANCARTEITPPPIHFEVFQQDPGVTMTFKTSNLSAGSDTVMHVSDFISDQFIDGNDDCPGNPAGDNSSCITIPPAASLRFLVVFIRGKTDLTGGMS